MWTKHFKTRRVTAKLLVFTSLSLKLFWTLKHSVEHWVDEEWIFILLVWSGICQCMRNINIIFQVHFFIKLWSGSQSLTSPEAFNRLSSNLCNFSLFMNGIKQNSYLNLKFVSIFYSTIELFCDVFSKDVSISIKEVLATSAQTKIILGYF